MHTVPYLGQLSRELVMLSGVGLQVKELHVAVLVRESVYGNALPPPIHRLPVLLHAFAHVGRNAVECHHVNAERGLLGNRQSRVDITTLKGQIDIEIKTPRLAFSE